MGNILKPQSAPRPAPSSSERKSPPFKGVSQPAGSSLAQGGIKINGQNG